MSTSDLDHPGLGAAILLRTDGDASTILANEAFAALDDQQRLRALVAAGDALLGLAHALVQRIEGEQQGSGSLGLRA